METVSHTKNLGENGKILTYSFLLLNFVFKSWNFFNFFALCEKNIQKNNQVCHV